MGKKVKNLNKICIQLLDDFMDGWMNKYTAIILIKSRELSECILMEKDSSNCKEKQELLTTLQSSVYNEGLTILKHSIVPMLLNKVPIIIKIYFRLH